VSTASVQADLVKTCAALADQTRWDILTRLGARELSASALADEMPVSRQAIAKHLAALSDAGLVEPVPIGREIRYRALGARLSEVANQLDRIGSLASRRSPSNSQSRPRAARG
jgi:DNA-binding transcriptional ArsR family regulator